TSGVNDAISQLIPQGRVYEFGNNLNSRLTDVSAVEFWYNGSFIRPGLDRIDPSKNISNSYGMKLTMSF
ncbi:MAG TPA: hypothetical protein PLQ76_09505, partial [bacterium]|nr:hypothetical protein [bacterium]